MTGPPTATGDAPVKMPRTVRMRNAILGSVVAFVIGVGLGAGGASTPTAGIAAATQTPPTASSALAPTVAPSDALAVEPTLEPTEQPTPEPTAAPAKPVVVKGTGSRNTKPFDMPAGDFTVVITGTGHSNVIASLVPRGSDVFEGESLFNEISNGKYRYETVIYGIEAGSYYLYMVNENAWVVTFTPLL